MTMKIEKRDDYNEPILVFGGPYSNLQALEAIQGVAKAQGIAPSHVFCTGDIVAYYSQPSECIDLIQKWGINVVQGNCEYAVATGAEDCGCGFAEDSTCEVAAKHWYRYLTDQVSAKQAKWMAQLPQQISFKFNGLNVALLHASVEQNNKYLFPSTADCYFLKEFKETKSELIIAGHSGIPFTKEVIDERCAYIWHNAGAIGLPANDGKPNTWYSLIKPKRRLGRIEIMHKKLTYDYKLAAKNMRDANYCNDYATSLLTGMWPSMDILPEAERSGAGRRLKLRP